MDKVVKERFKGLERALKLQAKEYKRRLNELNGEASRIKESQDKSISVEKFEGVVNQLNARMDGIVNDIQALSDVHTKLEGRNAWTEKYIPWGIATILAIITILLSYFQIRRELYTCFVRWARSRILKG